MDFQNIQFYHTENKEGLFFSDGHKMLKTSEQYKISGVFVGKKI